MKQTRTLPKDMVLRRVEFRMTDPLTDEDGLFVVYKLDKLDALDSAAPSRQPPILVIDEGDTQRSGSGESAELDAFLREALPLLRDPSSIVREVPVDEVKHLQWGLGILIV